MGRSILKLWLGVLLIGLVFVGVISLVSSRLQDQSTSFDEYTFATFVPDPEKNVLQFDEDTQQVDVSTQELLIHCGLDAPSTVYLLVNGEVYAAEKIHKSKISEKWNITFNQEQTEVNDLNIILTDTNTKTACSLRTPLLIFKDHPLKDSYLSLSFVDSTSTISDQFVGELRQRMINNMVLIPKKKSPFLIENDQKVVLEKKDQQNYVVRFVTTDGQQVELPIENEYFWIKFDEGFNQNAFFWDDAISAWYFTKYDPVLAEKTLDFWYDMQVTDGKYGGLIPREIRIENLKNDLHQLKKGNTLNTVSYHLLASPQVNNPFFVNKIELDLYLETGNKERLNAVLPKFIAYFEYIENNKRSGEEHLYLWDTFGSGMDNSPRCSYPNCGYIDLISQQAVLARDIAQIASILNDPTLQQEYSDKYLQLKQSIVEHHYDPSDGFFYDVPTQDSSQQFERERTIAAIWALYAGVLSPEQAEMFVETYLISPSEFGGEPPLPSLSRSSTQFNESGDYWRGGVWPPMIWITLVSLEQYPEHKDLAQQIARFYFTHMEKLYTRDQTLYEYYEPSLENNMLISGRNPVAKKDFFGWGALPIKLYSFLECDSDSLECENLDNLNP